jgi:hypothetical protein
VAAHVDAGRGVEGGALRASIRRHQLAQLRGRDLRHRFGAFGRPGGDELLHFVCAAHVLRDARAIDASLREEFVQEREEEEHVAAGADRHPLARDLRGLGTPRIDHDDAPAARLDRLQALPRVRDLEEAPLRDDGIRADDEQALRAVEIRERLREREAVDVARDGELVGAVLCRWRVQAFRAESRHEALREDRVQHTEACGGAHVHRDRIGRRVPANRLHLRADLGERLLPGDPDMAVADLLHRVFQSIGRIEELVLLEPLHTREAARRDVGGVGADRGDALPVLDRHLETAERLADAAEGVLRLGVRRAHRSSRFRIFPVGPFGSASTNSTVRGYL